MNLITDRTRVDVLLGNKKGFYGYEDLNRVEQAVSELANMLQSIGVVCAPDVKTDWKEGDIPNEADLSRYLGNVADICTLAGVDAVLPGSMDKLNWEGANQIEFALLSAHKKLLNG